MNVGDIVKFKDGLYEDEEGQLYTIIEYNGVRVILEYICDWETLRPTSVAVTKELEVVPPEDIPKLYPHLIGKGISLSELEARLSKDAKSKKPASPPER